jgi:glycosyltransferase involved in cell wall biosynthesis
MSWQIIKLLEKNGYGDKIVFTPHYEGIGFTKIKDIMHRFYRLIAKSSFSIPQKIICVSDYEMRILTTTFDIPNEKIVVIPNGVDYNFPRETVKKIKGDNLKILYVGRLREYKGVQYILRSLRYIQDNYSYNIEFTVVGNGDYEDNLRNLTEKLNLDCVNYLGSVSKDELDELYSTSDLFILPSKSECYGIVVAEALANGLITIVSKETALIEFLSESGCFGIEYPPNCTELGELICNFVNKEISIGPFSNKICQWNNVANNYISVYMSIN